LWVRSRVVGRYITCDGGVCTDLCIQRGNTSNMRIADPTAMIAKHPPTTLYLVYRQKKSLCVDANNRAQPRGYPIQHHPHHSTRTEQRLDAFVMRTSPSTAVHISCIPESTMRGTLEIRSAALALICTCMISNGKWHQHLIPLSLHAHAQHSILAQRSSKINRLWTHPTTQTQVTPRSCRWACRAKDHGRRVPSPGTRPGGWAHGVFAC